MKSDIVKHNPQDVLYSIKNDGHLPNYLCILILEIYYTKSRRVKNKCLIRLVL